jgi:hypothetical protein
MSQSIVILLYNKLMVKNLHKLPLKKIITCLLLLIKVFVKIKYTLKIVNIQILILKFSGQLQKQKIKNSQLQVYWKIVFRMFTVQTELS